MINSINTNAISSTQALEVTSIQSAFALLQIELAKENKSNAQSLIESVKENQEHSKKYAESIAHLNSLDAEVLGNFKFPDSQAGLVDKMTECQKNIDTIQAQIDAIKNAKSDAELTGNIKFKCDAEAGKLYELDPTIADKLKNFANDAGGSANFEKYLLGDDNVLSLSELESSLNEFKRYKDYCGHLSQAISTGLPETFLKSGFDKTTLSKMVSSMQALQEQYGTNNQTLMVQIQDKLGQYNANVQGANAAIQQANNVTSSLAKGG